MSLLLNLNVENPDLSVFEALIVRVKLSNEGEKSLEIPGLYDVTDALTFVLRSETGRRVRIMNGITHQRMSTLSRIDEQPMLERLDSGASWERSFDLSQYHYTLAAGEYTLEAVYEYLPEDVSVGSTNCAVHVTDAPLLDVHASRANPVLDGTAMVLKSEGREGVEIVLRQHNHSRPLAAWYSSRLQVSRQTESAVVASPTFHRTDSFDHFFDRWLVWKDQGQLSARKYTWGRPGTGSVTSPVPRHGQVLKAASVDAADRLYVFLLTPGVDVSGYVFSNDTLRSLFSLPIPAVSPDLVTTGMDAEHIHVAACFNGQVMYHRFDLEGVENDRRVMHRTAFSPVGCWFDVVEQSICAACVEPGARKVIELFSVDLEGAEPHTLTLNLGDEKTALRELGMARDVKGRFHALYATIDGRLFYSYGDREAVEVAAGMDRFHPHVVASKDVYLGWAQTGRGYRFAHVNRGTFPENPIVDYEAEP